MAIKINLMPRQEADSAGEKETRPFYFVIVLIFFVITLISCAGVYAYTNFILKKQLDDINRQSSEIQDSISRTATKDQLSILNTVVLKGKSIKTILSNHNYSLRIVKLLESLTIKSVVYDKFLEENGEDGTIKVTISGSAESFYALAKQLMVFKKSKDIKEVIFNDAMGGKDAKVSFSIVLILDSKYIITQPVVTLKGSSSVRIIKDSAYSDEGATAIDGVDGILYVTTSGEVDTKATGTYTLTYTATNGVGNSVSETRTVEVTAE